MHQQVDYYGGSTNKNIGDAFLLIWKFPETEIMVGEKKSLKLAKSTTVNQIADMSMISFLKIISKINTSHKICKYRKHPKLTKVMPN